jgi:hypothetical protein
MAARVVAWLTAVGRFGKLCSNLSVYLALAPATASVLRRDRSVTTCFRGCVIALALCFALPGVGFAQGNGNAQNGGVQQRLAALEAALADALAVIAQLRGADAALQGKIDVEAATRAAADAALQSNVGAEAAARQAADAALQSNIGAEAATRQTADAALQSNIGAEAATRQTADAVLRRDLDDEIESRQLAGIDLANEVGTLASRVTALQQTLAVPQSLLDLAPYVSVNQNTLNGVIGPHVIFTGANLHIRDGSGNTFNVDAIGNAVPTGVGNLIVGYNESVAPSRAGSHNLVIGPFHNYSSVGGFVAGLRNSISGRSSAVNGGTDNTASGELSAVSGGARNTAAGFSSTVSGRVNIAISDSFSHVP